MPATLGNGLDASTGSDAQRKAGAALVAAVLVTRSSASMSTIGTETRTTTTPTTSSHSASAAIFLVATTATLTTTPCHRPSRDVRHPQNRATPAHLESQRPMPMDVDEDDLIGKPSDKVPKQDPTDDDCMGKRTEDGQFVGYCRSTPGRGTDHVGEGRCKHHGGCNDGDNGQGAPEGEANGSYEHGAYTDHIISDLSDREERAFESLVDSLQDEDDDEQPTDVIREQAVEAYLKYKRSGDARFLREYRQLLSEFNIVDNTDHTEVDANISADEAYAELVGAASQETTDE